MRPLAHTYRTNLSMGATTDLSGASVDELLMAIKMLVDVGGAVFKRGAFKISRETRLRNLQHTRNFEFRRRRLSLSIFWYCACFSVLCTFVLLGLR